MADLDNSRSLLERYASAVRWTPPKIAAETPGPAIEGYWLDENMFFFVSERMDPSLGHIVAIPSIANCQLGSIEEVISLDDLARALSDNLGRQIDMAALSLAEFDMPDHDRLAVAVAGKDYLLDRHRHHVSRAQESLKVPALYSPDGRYACFVNGHNLWIKDGQLEADRPLTHDGERHHCYGQLPEASLSALSYRKSPSPVGVWSPDSQWFLTRRIDERDLPEVALVEHAPPDGGRPILHTFKYPLPGDPIPVATYTVIHAASGRMVAFNDFPAPVTAPWAHRLDAWFAGAGATVWAISFDRYSRSAELICLDVATGTGRLVLSESVSDGYIDLYHDMNGAPNVRMLTDSDEVIWFSERDNWGHLYLYEASTGRLKNQITKGPWLVRDIVHVDKAERKILFLAGGVDPRVDPARRALCAIGLDGGGFEVLIEHDGDVSLVRSELWGLEQTRRFRPSQAQGSVSPGGRFAVVRYASVTHGNRTEIIDLRTGTGGLVIASTRPRLDETLPRPFTALAADNLTRLHGLMYVPSDFEKGRRYPLIDCIYPGPQTTLQPHAFRSMRAAAAQSLAELGFVTIQLDTRGMPTRSRAFHQAGYGKLLEPQLADHAAVVRQLSERYAYIDGDRIGIVGMSAGGAASVRAMLDYGDIFKVGVSVCGAHNASHCMAPWSDKYRGPENRESWLREANGAAAHKLRGKLLLVSGDMDERVPVSQTLSLVDALVRANREFELLIIPNEGHGVLDSGYAQRRVWDFLVRNLLAEVPPANFLVRFEPGELTRLYKFGVWEWL